MQVKMEKTEVERMKERKALEVVAEGMIHGGRGCSGGGE